ncbi:MAG TPA: glycosyltransferase family 4 protein [Syntrophorhabdaceae bacterium]|nr:glycosyltransferase family 4 protein [Syntrophorhabdaceae bacterium]
MVFKNEVELLKKNGVDVITYEKQNDEIRDYGLRDKLFLPLRNVWSWKTYRELKQLIKKEKPDVAHFHNIFYLISPSAYYACREEGVPVVQTLHNFRIFCANGLLMRHGEICEECMPQKTGYRLWVKGDRLKIIKNAIKYGCYRNSRFYSLPIAFMQCFHWLKKTWIDTVDSYIALTEFGKKKFIEAELPADKIFVKPNFLANPPKPNYTHKNYAVFIGRLSIEKGVNILIDAFKNFQPNTFNLPPRTYDPSLLTPYPSPSTYNPSPMTHYLLHLKIIGDGPLRGELEDKVRTEGINNIKFTGRKDFNEAMALLRNARFMVMPSIWYEGFPMVIREAFACGKPVIASRLGAMAELVEDGKTGLLFEPGNSEGLAEKIRWMTAHEDECIQMGRNARKVFEERYIAEKNFAMLMKIYEKAIVHSSVK